MKPIVITFASLKGGTGKSSCTILLANCLAAAGKRCLVLDMDLNNSASFYYLADGSVADTKNIAAAIQFNDLKKNITETNRPNVHLIPSSLYLVDLRAMATNRLAAIIDQLDDLYDYVLIDTAPTYDNLTLNAINASSLIVTPVNLSQFDINTSLFMQGKLKSETTKFENWVLLINGFSEYWAKFAHSGQGEYMEVFASYFDNILPVHLPESTWVRKYIDRSDKLSHTKDKSKLFGAICNLAAIIADETIDLKEM